MGFTRKYFSVLPFTLFLLFLFWFPTSSRSSLNKVIKVIDSFSKKINLNLAYAQTSDPIIAAAGDIACGYDSTGAACKQNDTANLVVSLNPTAVLVMGDLQYENGSLDRFNGLDPYGNPAYNGSWGRVKAITYPAVGNHEYLTSGAAGYFDYFNGVGNSTGPAGDRSKGYYATDIGSWRLYAINSNCSKIGGCGIGSAQEQWLRSDLAAHPNTCQLIYMHHPLYTSQTNYDFPELQPLYKAFYEYGGDVALVGHSHFYERYAPQDPTQQDPTCGTNPQQNICPTRIRDDSRGIREFMVGTGGRNTYGPSEIEPNSEVRSSSNQFGVLKMTLHSSSYDWQFLPAVGSTFSDSGSSPCVSIAGNPTPSPIITNTLISTGSDWKYLDDGTDQGTVWTNTTFAESGWKAGPAELGYGEGDEATVVSYGPNSSNKYITTYFRKSFTITDPADFTSLSLRILRDDGAVVYLNGTEVYRTNMPTGPISYTTLATSAIEEAWYQINISPGLLLNGTNVIAVEIHQANVTSSDISFDFELTGISSGGGASPLPSPSLTPSPSPLSGDANGDGKIDLADYNIWLINYGVTGSNGASIGDFNYDGAVNGIDFAIWLINYQPPTTPLPSPSASPTAIFQPTAPYYGTFFYPWFENPITDGTGKWGNWDDFHPDIPNTWYSRYLPNLDLDAFSPASELYSSKNYETFKWQLQKLAEAKEEVAISSWWGSTHRTDSAFRTLVTDFMYRGDNPYPNLRWTVYYENEAGSDPSTLTIENDLSYLNLNYFNQPSYFKIGGRPVVFVYGDDADTNTGCGMSDRWVTARDNFKNSSGVDMYLVLKVFRGYSSCTKQPDSWHQYAPGDLRSQQHGSYAYFVSPGFWKDNELERLPRNLTEFENAITNMVGAAVQWKLVETWNEWGEGSSVEPGDKVNQNTIPWSQDASLPFQDNYIDALCNRLPTLEQGTGAGTSFPCNTP